MYFEPDGIWKSYRINNLEDYLESWVVKGKFHKDVHEDIIEAYKTVEYLMAHSYYYWRMYDEALKKLLGIFEMSVKLRCQELNISLSSTNQKGAQRKKTLANLIEELIGFGYPIELKSSLDWVRTLRNMSSHPDRHSFGGGVMKQPVVPILNIINLIFCNPKFTVAQIKKLDENKLKFKSLQSLYIYNHEGKDILIYNPRPTKSIDVSGKWINAWYFTPVLTDTKKRLIERSFPSDILVFLTDEAITSNELYAINYVTKSEVRLLKTSKDKNLEAYKKHTQELDSFDKVEKFSSLSLYNSQNIGNTSQFIFENCWC